jgi:hypothetical protein
MKSTIRRLFGIPCLLVVPTTGGAQSIETTNLPANHKAPDGKPTKAGDGNSETNKEKVERIRKERRANAIAADFTRRRSGQFSDEAERARTQARIADSLWDDDNERSRELFRKAWKAAEVADKETLQQSLQQAGQEKGRNGSVDVSATAELARGSLTSGRSARSRSW